MMAVAQNVVMGKGCIFVESGGEGCLFGECLGNKVGGGYWNGSARGERGGSTWGGPRNLGIPEGVYEAMSGQARDDLVILMLGGTWRAGIKAASKRVGVLG